MARLPVINVEWNPRRAEPWHPREGVMMETQELEDMPEIVVDRSPDGAGHPHASPGERLQAARPVGLVAGSRTR